MRHNDPELTGTVSHDSLHIRLAKWRLSNLREWLIFANKLFTLLFTRVSFCSSSGSSSIVIGCLAFFVALVLFRAGANSVNICCLSKTFQELQHLPTLLLDKLGNPVLHSLELLS
jgi:hypothetical protein